jgi:hypothetical protein
LLAFKRWSPGFQGSLISVAKIVLTSTGDTLLCTQGNPDSAGGAPPNSFPARSHLAATWLMSVALLEGSQRVKFAMATHNFLDGAGFGCVGSSVKTLDTETFPFSVLVPFQRHQYPIFIFIAVETVRGVKCRQLRSQTQEFVSMGVRRNQYKTRVTENPWMKKSTS